MNKIFFVISIIVYISNYILTESFNIETYNTLWSAISLTALFTPLCIGCVINSIIYKKKILHGDLCFITFHLCLH